VADDLEPQEMGNLRRSIVMPRPGQAAGLDRDRPVRLLEDRQRVPRSHRQRSHRQRGELIDQLRAVLARGDG
jgi:hypothetical protein